MRHKYANWKRKKVQIDKRRKAHANWKRRAEAQTLHAGNRRYILLADKNKKKQNLSSKSKRIFIKILKYELKKLQN